MKRKNHTQSQTLKILLASLLTASAFTTAVFAKGSVFEGKVVLDGTQGMAVGSKIELIEPETLQTISTATTDENGAYTLVTNTTGTYYLRYSYPGYMNAQTSKITIPTDACFVDVPDVVLLGGDIDRDGKVTMQDKLWYYRTQTGNVGKSQWLTRSTDYNADGTTDSEDLAIISANLGKNVPSYNLSASLIGDVRPNNYASYFIMSEEGLTTQNTKDKDGMMQSGWIYDNSGSFPKKSDSSPYPLQDISETDGTAYVRQLSATSEGIIHLRTRILISGNNGNGAGIMFYAKDETPVYELYSTDGYLCFRTPEGTLASSGVETPEGKVIYIYAILDLDKGTSQTYLNGIDTGVIPLASNKAIYNYKCFTGKEEKDIFISQGAIFASVNHGIFDDFNYRTPDGTPIGWKSTAESHSKVSYDNNELVIYSDNREGLSPKASAYKKSHTRLAGNVIFETLEYLSEKTDNLCITLKYKDIDVVKLYTQGDSFYANGVMVKETYERHFWNSVRIEANTDTETAFISINGKRNGTVNFLESVPYIDGLEFSLAANNDPSSTAKFDNIKLYQEKEITDYVPAPVVPTDSNNYYVGINMCNLWQNGSHWGWDNISAYSPQTPVTGFFDESNVEHADWQLKYMADHGIDFQFICWYPRGTNEPIKSTGSAQGLHDGYFNAKYSDYVDFAIIWEADNASKPQDFEAFKNYYVPYLVEYYLSDPRYAQIDGYAIFGMFGASKFRTHVGSADICKEYLDYLEQVCIDQLGYKGVIFLACDTTSSATAQDAHYRAGFDGQYAYNYGYMGYDIEYTKNAHISQHNTGAIHVVPTVSTGFNNIAWGDSKKPNMSTADMRSIFSWVKSDVLGGWYAGASGKDAWKKRLVMLSTWNEFGEGTYIMPSGLNGFGYVDEIKLAFTDNNTSCSDVTPTAAQKERLGYLYPSYRKSLRPTMNGRSNYVPLSLCSSTSLKTISYINGTSYNSSAFTAGTSGFNQQGYDSTQQAIKFTSTNTDPMFTTKTFSISASTVSTVVVRAKIPKGSSMQIFFKRSTDSGLAENRSVKLFSTTDDWADYSFGVSGNPYWNGTITQIRFDPLTASGKVFYLKSIELRGPATTTLYINGTQYFMDRIFSIDDVKLESTTPSIPTYNAPYTENNNLLIPFYPEHGIQYMLKLGYVWDSDAQSLRLRGQGIDVTYYMGSDTAVVNGNTVTLTCTPRFNDGLPMIPINHIIDLMGDGFTFTSSRSGDAITYNITTPWNGFDAYESNAENYMWEFNQMVDLEGWTAAACSVLNTTENTIYGVATTSSGNYDPVIRIKELSFSPAEYDKIAVRMKVNSPENTTVQMFFNGTMGEEILGDKESRSLCIPYSTENNDQFVEYVFDFSTDDEFKSLDTVTGWRFDPINCAGTFEIDWIRMYKSDEAMTYGDNAALSSISGRNIDNLTVSDGVLSGSTAYLSDTSYKYDPNLTFPEFKYLDSCYFNAIDVTMKYTLTGQSTSVTNLFYCTDQMTNFDSSHKTSINLTAAEGAEYKTYTFDLSQNEKWSETGLIKGIRFDPLETEGSFQIDSIRFYHK